MGAVRAILAGWAVGVLVGAAGGDGKPSDLVRSESFQLAFVGAEEPMGRGELRRRVGSDPDGPWHQLELGWQLDPIGTRVDRFVRTRGARTTISYRAWRQLEGLDRVSGHTLVAERIGPAAEVREWAGREMGQRVEAAGFDLLELFELTRPVGRGLARPAARRVPVFVPEEGAARELLLLRMPLLVPVAGMPPVTRVVVWDPELELASAEWQFVGRRLCAFRVGEVVGTAVPVRPREEVLVSGGAAGPTASVPKEGTKPSTPPTL